ncbi:MAG: LTA synthase family protein, partial [Lachnospiraceae bacterium]|nr:LTA synthase family protein [Lachnospiraceae bacterium]
GIHEGTMMQYHQRRKGTKYYMQDMEMLQYDMLYGKQYAYGERGLYEATELVMGIRRAAVTGVEYTSQNRAYVFGQNFTQYSKAAVNGKVQETQFLNDRALILPDVKLKKGDVVTVQQVDKNGLVLQESSAIKVK